MWFWKKSPPASTVPTNSFTEAWLAANTRQSMTDERRSELLDQWAEDVTRDGLEPDPVTKDVHVWGIRVARIHLAFNAEVPPHQRAEFRRRIDAALREGLR